MGAGLLHGHWSDLSLTIISSDHHEYTETLHLWIERLERRPTPMKGISTPYEPVSPAVRTFPAHVDQSEQLDRLQRSRKGEFVPPRCEDGFALISSSQKEAQKDRVVRNLRNS